MMKIPGFLLFLISICQATPLPVPLEPLTPSSANPLADVRSGAATDVIASSSRQSKVTYSIELVVGQPFKVDLQGGGAGSAVYFVESESEQSIASGAIDQTNTFSEAFIAQESGRYLITVASSSVEPLQVFLQVIINQVSEGEFDSEMDLGQVMVPVSQRMKQVAVSGVGQGAEYDAYRVSMVPGAKFSAASALAGVSIRLVDSDGALLAVGQTDVEGLSGLIAGYEHPVAEDVFIEVSAGVSQAYEIVAAIEEGGDSFSRARFNRLVLREDIIPGNISAATEQGSLLSSTIFSAREYRIRLAAMTPVVVQLTAGLDYEISDPGGAQVLEGETSVEGGSSLEFVTSMGGEYSLSISSDSGRLLPFSATLETGLFLEGEVDASGEAELARPLGDFFSQIDPQIQLLQLGGQVGVTGSSINEVEPNDRLSQAQDVHDAAWMVQFDPNIAESDTIPHLTIQGAGSGDLDYYYIETTQPGRRLICDLDNTTVVDGFLRVYSVNTGQVLFENDDVISSDPGSSTSLDSFLDVTLGGAGGYVVEVGSYPDGSVVDNGATYSLHLSLEGQSVTDPTAGGDALDYYSVPIREGQILIVGVDDSAANVELTVGDNQITGSSFPAFGLGKVAVHQIEDDGEALIAVSAAGSREYRLIVYQGAFAGFFSTFNRSPESFVRFGDDEPVVGVLSTDTQRDFYRLDLRNRPRELVLYEINAGGFPGSVGLRFYDEHLIAVQEWWPTEEGGRFEIPESLGEDVLFSVSRREGMAQSYLISVPAEFPRGRIEGVIEMLDNGDVKVSWLVGEGEVYQLEHSEDFMQWSQEPAITADEFGLLEWTVPRDGLRRFYRLALPVVEEN